MFFYVLLPPIILDAGYNMQKSRFFRNIHKILVFALPGTCLSTLTIGLVLWALDPGVLVGAGGDGALWGCLRFGALISVRRADRRRQY